MSFTAQYRGVCEDCGGRIHLGDEIAYRGNEAGPVHVTCPLGADPTAIPKETLCPVCFMYHAGECL